MTERAIDDPLGLLNSPLDLLYHLWALTGHFTSRDQDIAYVHIYARPAGDGQIYPLRFTVARESGYEGVACLDDTARAAVLALKMYELTADPRALQLATAWLNFVHYMQGSDGSFSNFILDEAGHKNLTGPTSTRGGYGWTARALWALSLAWRLTGDASHLRTFRRCSRPQGSDDMKMNGLTAVALMELLHGQQDGEIAREIEDLCDHIMAARSASSYFQDAPSQELVHFWGYHQLLAVARAGRMLGRRDYLDAAQGAVEALVRPAVEDLFYYSWPPVVKEGLTAYCITPLVQGLAEIYRATGDESMSRLALRSCRWFTGLNDLGQPLYDPTTGRCADGLDQISPSSNCGAESSVEAGLAEVERRALANDTTTSDDTTV